MLSVVQLSRSSALAFNWMLHTQGYVKLRATFAGAVILIVFFIYGYIGRVLFGGI